MEEEEWNKSKHGKNEKKTKSFYSENNDLRLIVNSEIGEQNKALQEQETITRSPRPRMTQFNSDELTAELFQNLVVIHT